ncbi:MAG: hypothetical protein V4613_06970 [Bacteroidota bacterium]
MKKKFALLLFSIVAIGAIAQKSYHLKIFNSSTYKHDKQYYSWLSNEKTSLTLFKFAPAFAITKNKSTLEFIITNCSFAKTTWREQYIIDSNKIIHSRYQTRNALYSVMATKYWQVMTSSNQKFKAHIGIGLEPNFSSYKVLKTSNSYNSRILTIGLNGYITPRCTYDLNDKFSLELNLPFQPMALTYTQSKIDNPNFTPDQQKYDQSDAKNFPPYFALNIGLAYRL